MNKLGFHWNHLVFFAATHSLLFGSVWCWWLRGDQQVVRSKFTEVFLISNTLLEELFSIRFIWGSCLGPCSENARLLFVCCYFGMIYAAPSIDRLSRGRGRGGVQYFDVTSALFEQGCSVFHNDGCTALDWLSWGVFSVSQWWVHSPRLTVWVGVFSVSQWWVHSPRLTVWAGVFSVLQWWVHSPRLTVWAGLFSVSQWWVHSPRLTVWVGVFSVSQWWVHGPRLTEWGCSVFHNDGCTALNWLLEQGCSVFHNDGCTALDWLFERECSVFQNNGCTALDWLFERGCSVFHSEGCTALDWLSGGVQCFTMMGARPSIDWVGVFSVLQWWVHGPRLTEWGCSVFYNDGCTALDWLSGGVQCFTMMGARPSIDWVGVFSVLQWWVHGPRLTEWFFLVFYNDGCMALDWLSGGVQCFTMMGAQPSIDWVGVFSVLQWWVHGPRLTVWVGVYSVSQWWVHGPRLTVWVGVYSVSQWWVHDPRLTERGCSVFHNDGCTALDWLFEWGCSVFHNDGCTALNWLFERGCSVFHNDGCTALDWLSGGVQCFTMMGARPSIDWVGVFSVLQWWVHGPRLTEWGCSVFYNDGCTALDWLSGGVQCFTMMGARPSIDCLSGGVQCFRMMGAQPSIDCLSGGVQCFTMMGAWPSIDWAGVFSVSQWWVHGPRLTVWGGVFSVSQWWVHSPRLTVWTGVFSVSQWWVHGPRLTVWAGLFSVSQWWVHGPRLTVWAGVFSVLQWWKHGPQLTV